MTPKSQLLEKKKFVGFCTTGLGEGDANTLDPAYLDLSTCSPKEDTQMANKHTKELLNITDH